jgi:predicted esterase
MAKFEPFQVYRGDFDASLRNPLLLIAETYDPATPLRNGRRLAKALGKDNARLSKSIMPSFEIFSDV